MPNLDWSRGPADASQRLVIFLETTSKVLLSRKEVNSELVLVGSGRPVNGLRLATLRPPVPLFLNVATISTATMSTNGDREEDDPQTPKASQTSNELDGALEHGEADEASSSRRVPPAIRVPGSHDSSEHTDDDVSDSSTRPSHDIPANGFFSPHDGPLPHLPTEAEPESPEPPRIQTEPPPDPVEQPPPVPSKEAEERLPNRTLAAPEQGDTQSERPSRDVRKSSVPSMVFVADALEKIAASKEARRRKSLADSVQTALTAIRDDQVGNPEVIFEPLRQAIETLNVPLTTISLDCMGKLITYSYFSTPASTSAPADSTDKAHVPLIERAIDTICDCFQDEATPADVQLQIVKSLLEAVLNDKVIVHGAGLLKAVRQVYNIFLLSKSAPNQQVSQSALTQMVGTVFERVRGRLTTKEVRLGMGKYASGKGTANGSQTDLSVQHASPKVGETEQEADGDGSSEGASTFVSEPNGNTEPREKMTLQSFENPKNVFDDTRIGDNAPTTVTQASTRLKPPRRASDQHMNGDDESHLGEDEEEDEIFVKDAFLVFRSMCRLSTKILAQEQLQDLRSQNMRSKLVSLSIIRMLMNNNMDVFTSPLVTIRSSTNNEPTSFGQAINQYLRLALSRNGASSVRQVFETSCEIFWLMLKDMRVMLKREMEVFLKEIYLSILERRNAPSFQKLYIMKILTRLASEPRALVEIYLNYDCDRNALDNIFQRIIEHLSRICSTPFNASAQQQHQYQENHGRDIRYEMDWREHGRIPPNLTTAGLANVAPLDLDLPVEYVLKQHSLETLVRTLQSLVLWSQETLAASVDRNPDVASRISIDDASTTNEIRGSPRPASDTPIAPGTPVLDDDPGQFEKAKQKKTAFNNGIRQFNFKPKRGIKMLIADGFIKSDSAEDVANFVIQNDSLDKAMIGEYLGEGDQYNVAIMHAFVDSMDFTKRRFVDALRQFLQSFRLPGEAQKIDRFMLKFAERYITGNPNAFANADTAYVLAYSVIMLNTDQHSQKIKGRRMTKEDFIKNNRGINDNADLPEEYLIGIFEEIAQNEIVLNAEREHAAALGIINPPSGSGGLFGKDLAREAAHQADQEMSSKAEQRLRSMIRLQRKVATKPGLPKYVPATSFRHVGFMFDVTWMSFLSAFSAQMQIAQNLENIKMCMEGIRLAIKVSCLFDLETPRVAFVTALANLTNLNNLREMTAKNLEALKALLGIALTEGNTLKGSWSDVLTCVSQLDRLQLISGGVDEDIVPDMRKQSIIHMQRPPIGPTRKSSASRRSKTAGGPNSAFFQSEIAQDMRSADMVKTVDRIFAGTADLSGEAIVHFVRALSEVSWQEIQSSGHSDSPRMYSLQKLVEISYYNMTRVRFEWTNIWQVLGEHFNEVGCHNNTHIVFFALDSLRQLSMRFMEIEELPGFKFQKDFLKPFEHVIANSQVVLVKDMVLQCLIQMITARGDNIRSGWKTMFGVFTVAAREVYEGLVNIAFEQVTNIYNNRFGVVIAQGAFADLIVCLTEFSKNLKFQKKSLQAIELLKSTVWRMLRTPECPLSQRNEKAPQAGRVDNAVVSRYADRQTQNEQFWFPVLFAFHDVLMTGEDLEVRSLALNYLFETLIKHGGDFQPEFWDTLWRQLLYPIFMVLKSKSEMSKVANHEDLSVWLSTTMIQALRSMIALFTHYFESLEYMLDRFLDLLALCICQENDTIARIGSNCLQTLILQNVTKFQLEHWHQIVSAFVALFERTTAHQLFTAATKSSHQSAITDDEGIKESTENGLDDVSISEIQQKLPSQIPQETNGVVSDTPDRAESPPPTSSTQESDLEDYRPTTAPPQQPPVVTAARRRFFNKIITRCVLQLLMIETVNELFSNNDVYAQIPSPELLRLMVLLKKSYQFAKRFNNDKELRMRLWHEGFMRQPPNLLKQESGSAATYVSILVRMYFDEGDERRRNREETEAALIP